jgi:hypothetical protein
MTETYRLLQQLDTLSLIACAKPYLSEENFRSCYFPVIYPPEPQFLALNHISPDGTVELQRCVSYQAKEWLSVGRKSHCKILVVYSAWSDYIVVTYMYI